MEVSVIYITPMLYPSLHPLEPKAVTIFVLIELILSLLWYVVVKKLKKWLLPVLGKQLCKLRLLHLLCGLFDARDWNGPRNTVTGLLLVLLQGSATVIFGEPLAMVW
jgi:hypothetical protein